jgi:hypothetical protein
MPAKSTDAPANTSVALKIALVMGDLERIEKDGYNTHSSYAYTTLDAMYDAVRRVMAAHRLVIIPDLERVENLEWKNKGYLYRIHMVFNLVDADSGDSRVCRWQAEGSDFSDKGLNKAMMTALKFFLKSTFLISTGDPDPDGETPPPLERGEEPVSLPMTEEERDRQKWLAGVMQCHKGLRVLHKKLGLKPPVDLPKNVLDLASDALVTMGREMKDELRELEAQLKAKEEAEENKPAVAPEPEEDENQPF